MKNLLAFFVTMLCTISLSAQGPNDDWTFHHDPTDGWFSALAEDSNGNIIVGGGSPNSHFRIYDGTTWTLYHPNDYALNYNFYGRDLAVDSEDNIWISPGNQDGVTKWNGTTFENFNTSNSDIISNSNFGVAIDQNDKLWTSSRQSFDGTEWDTYPHNDCYFGGPRLVFIDDENDKWISGVISLGIETGIVTQPCVYQISNGGLTAFHFEHGDNLPELGVFSGQHLINQLSDGTIILVGKSTNGIEMKSFNGTSWDDFITFNSSEVGMSYWGIWVDENDNILLGGAKDNETAQIAKYCLQNDTWTFYDLPETSGFPPVIFDLMVDNQSRLWFTGNIGLASVPYVSTTCLTSGTESPFYTEFCSAVTYNQGFLYFQNCDESLIKELKFSVFDSVGKLIKKEEIGSSSVFVNELTSGIYFVQINTENNIPQILKFTVY